MHASASFTVVPNSAIAPRVFFPFWLELLLQRLLRGPRGAENFGLRQDTGRAHVYLDLVKTLEGIVVKDPLNVAHKVLRAYSFMVDTDAESSSCGRWTETSSRGRMSLPAWPYMALSTRCSHLGGGHRNLLSGVPRTNPRPTKGVMPQPRSASRTGAVTDGRMAAVGAPLTPRQLAERLNVVGHAQLRLMQTVVGGVSISKTTDYSSGLSQRALGRTRVGSRSAVTL